MEKIYCVFREDILLMCYEVETLDRVFKTREEAQAYIDQASTYSYYKRYIEEVTLGQER